MQAQEHDNQILQLIEKELLLPSPPAIAIQILNTVQKDDAALIELAEIISADPVLTAKMLKVANSGIFPCRSKITNIDRAMSMLGTNIIKNIALTFVLAADFSDNKYNGFDFDHFWRYSVTSAVAAETLAKAFQYNNDDIFVTALHQDLGMLVIALTKGIEYEVLLEEAQLPGVTSLTDLEQEKYGYDHQQVSYALLLSWNLPDSISTPILYHHQTEGASEGCQKAVEILHFADQLSAIYNEPGTAEKVRLLQQQLVERFSIDETQALELLDDIIEDYNESSIKIHKKCGFREIGYKEKVGKMSYGLHKGENRRDCFFLRFRSGHLFQYRLFASRRPTDPPLP